MNTVPCLKGEKGASVCAWCGRIISIREDVEGVSHGICPHCREKHFPQLDEDQEGAQEPAAIQMNLLCYEGENLVAKREVDCLTNHQLKICLDHQKAIGRDVVFELIW